MFAISFGRIFWKEYRVHRALWLSCLVIGCLFQIVLWWSVLDPQLRASCLSGGAASFPVMYAVGCGALLFAGEREDRTSDWLLSLSARPGPTLGAKAAFAIISTIALQIALALLSLILLGNTSSSPLELATPFALNILVWSSLGSLLSRRVLSSVPAMTLLCLLPHWVLFFTFEKLRWSGRESEFAMLAGVGALSLFALIVDFWLGWKWCQGKYIDGSTVEAAFAPRIHSWSGFTRVEQTRSRVPVQAEYEQSWRRTWQRLVWQERHRDSSYRVMLIAGIGLGILVAMTRNFLPNGFEREQIAFLFVGLISLTPLAVGVLGFRADATFQQPRFLANRGLSPAAVWLAKQAVWLPRAFILPCLAILVAAIFDSVFEVPANGQSIRTNAVAAISARPDLPIWITVLGYSCGQLAALLFQRTILAGAFGLFLNLVVLLWFSIMGFMSVPLWWSLGIPVLAMLLITLWQMKPWILERHSWSRKLKLGLVLVAIPVALVGFLAQYRIGEASAAPGIDQSLQNQFLSANSSLPVTVGEESIRRRLEQLSQAEKSEYQESADEIVSVLKSDFFETMPRFPSEELWLKQTSRIQLILGTQADVYLNENELAKSLDCHLANLKVARLMSRSSIYEWQNASYVVDNTMHQLVNWANHSMQSVDAIHQAIQSIEKEIAKYPSATEGIAKSYQLERRKWILSSRDELIEELTRLKATENSAVGFQLLPALLPWERRRADLLMTRAAEIRFAAVWSLEQRLTSPAMSAMRTVTREFTPIAQANDVLASTTPLVHFSQVNLYSFIHSVLNHHTNIRAGITRMELIAFRLRDGRLPERLVQLMDSINGNYLVDPWSDRLFDYYPSFLLSTGNSHAALVPVTSRDVEIVHDSPSRNIGRVDFTYVVSESAQAGTLNRDGTTSSYLYAIPPQLVRPQ